MFTKLQIICLTILLFGDGIELAARLNFDGSGISKLIVHLVVAGVIAANYKTAKPSWLLGQC